MSEIEKFDAGDTVRVCFTSSADSDGFIFIVDAEGEWAYFNYDSFVKYGEHQDVTVKIIKKSLPPGYYPVRYKSKYNVFYWGGEYWLDEGDDFTQRRESELTTQVGPRIAD